jgi:predicted transcriptional regulator
MLDFSKKPLRLGDLELAVLEYLWAHEEANTKCVHDALKDARQNTYKTIQSTLDRLYRRGILERRKVAHAFLYRCRFSRTEILTQKISDLAQELSRGETQSLLAAFVEFTARLDDATIAELETMIATRRRTLPESKP